MDCLARESASKALSTIRSVGPSISVDSEGLQIPSACDGQDGTREAMPPVGFGKIAWRSATMSEPGSAVRLESKPPRPEFCVHGPPRQLERLLRLSLVTCPVALYPATSESEKISFNQLNRFDLQRD